MMIRKTKPGDIPEIMQIYAEARAFMRENGNPTQWKEENMPRELIESDMTAGKSYVCIDNNASGAIIAVFYFCVEHEPVYDTLDGGKWLDNDLNNLNDLTPKYGVIHRIAKRTNAPKGIGSFCINWCFEQCGNIKIDTHENNAPMLKLLDNLGFIYCGIVRYPDGGTRIAFQKI